ncbi:MAG: bifunctional methylenetetrahydrofolate dehydrogenase/methenyltetrahydrofolate cyclohydrolase FolD [Chitinophagaceae bacterium]
MIISGIELSKKLREEMKKEVATYSGRLPHLLVILVGNNPASLSYVTGKQKASSLIGIKSSIIKLADTISENDLLEKINQFNKDNTIDGILVQLPLPKHINESKVINTISIEKDVDGFHPLNVAKLYLEEPCIHPCTPKGIITMLKNAHVAIAGKHAVIVGRSNIVGKPMSQLLLQKNATVTICHSKTTDLKSLTLQADILISAIGKPKFISADMIKQNAIVIDVGINRVEEKLVGDVDFENILHKASIITPVPGGVGPMTITSLLQNTLQIYKKNRAL